MKRTVIRKYEFLAKMITAFDLEVPESGDDELTLCMGEGDFPDGDIGVIMWVEADSGGPLGGVSMGETQH